MKILNACSQFIILITLFSCSKPVELDLPEFTNQPVVNCFFNPEEPFKVFVSRTASQFDTALVNIDDAQVQVFNHSQLVADLPSLGNGAYCDSTIFPEPGVFYTLKVNIPGYPEILASDSVPSSFSEFVYKGFKENAWYSDEGRAYNALIFEIDDQPEANYFEVMFRSYSWRYSSYYDSVISAHWISDFHCFDPVVEKGRWQAIFTDQLFDGANYSIQFMASSGFWIADSIKLDVQVIQGSEAFYNYRVTYQKHYITQYSDFFNPTEPVIMYSNIENGYGIFVGYRSKFYPIDFRN